MKMLVAVDGSKCSLEAVKSLIRQAHWYRQSPAVELVHVHLPLPQVRGMSRVVSKKDIERYYQEEGAAALAGARKLLDAAGVPYADHILVGRVAESIVEFAGKSKCDLILVGSHGRTEVGNMLLGSVATRVLHLSRIPVLVVPWARG